MSEAALMSGSVLQDSASPSPAFRLGTPRGALMSTHQIYFHLAWTTRDRLPMINVAARAFLDAFFRKTAIRQESEVVGLAILQTHVHMLVRTPARIDLPRLVQFFKGGSEPGRTPSGRGSRRASPPPQNGWLAGPLFPG